MGAYSLNGRRDEAIARIAGRQYGIVTRGQLFAVGISRRAISRRLGAARLHRVHAGVYSVGHLSMPREARWLAAALACGPGALLSHRSAAALWGIHDGEGAKPDVSLPFPRSRRHPGITVHRTGLQPADATWRAGIPVTSPARTLVDLAPLIEEPEIVRAVREAQFLRLFEPAAVREALSRRPSLVLGALADDLAPTQSRLEDRLLGICDRNRIPSPLTQQWLLGRRVDFLWPKERVVAETDGWQAHGTRSAFQADRRASNVFQLAGYAVLRFTHADLTRRPGAVADEIRRALARAPRRIETGKSRPLSG